LLFIMNQNQEKFVLQYGLKESIDVQLSKIVYPYGNLEEDIIVEHTGRVLTIKQMEEEEKARKKERERMLEEHNKKKMARMKLDEKNKNMNTLDSNTSPEGSQRPLKDPTGKDDVKVSKFHPNFNPNDPNDPNNPDDQDGDKNVADSIDDNKPDTEAAAKRQDIMTMQRLFGSNRPKNEVDAYGNNKVLIVEDNIFVGNKKNKKRKTYVKPGTAKKNILVIKRNPNDPNAPPSQGDPNNPNPNDESAPKNNNFINDVDRENPHDDDSDIDDTFGDEGDHNSDPDFETKQRKLLGQKLEIYNSTSRRKDLQALNLSWMAFLMKNIKNRHIFLTCLFDHSQLYTPVLKLTYLFFYFNLVLFINTMIYLFKADLIFPAIFSTNIVMFIIFSLVPVIGTNLIFYFVSLIFYINKGEIRLMLFKLRTNFGKFRMEWGPIKKNMKIKTSIFVGINIALWFLCLFFAFGVCAVYKNQSLALVLSYVVGIILDFCCISFITELLVSICYCGRKRRCCVDMLDPSNRIKSYKTISP
jgi:hypothetical protein